MRTRAAVALEAGKPLEVMEVNLEGPKAGEVLVELKATNPAMEEEIRYDIAELDRAYVELKQDLNEDLANREIVEAMIQNYRLKLKVLESILEQLHKTETKTPDNGTDDYLL